MRLPENPLTFALGAPLAAPWLGGCGRRILRVRHRTHPRERRLRWVGHGLRMGENRLIRKVLLRSFASERRVHGTPHVEAGSGAT